MTDSTSPMNPPDSPPSGPVIPEGLATKVGKIIPAIFGVTALVSAVLDGDHSEETITSLVLGVIVLVTMMGGRYLQAFAIFRDAPSPRQQEDIDDIDFLDVEPSEGEETLLSTGVHPGGEYGGTTFAEPEGARAGKPLTGLGQSTPPPTGPRKQGL